MENIYTPREVLFKIVDGLILKVSPLLPIEKTVEVCNIETKEEFMLCTSEYIDSIKMGNTLFVSQRVYEAIQ